jgi:hypothetical protein
MATTCKSLLNRAIAVLTLIAMPAAEALAGDSTGPTFGPFEGSSWFSAQGYQELKLDSDRWYVAYQGNRKTSSEWVDAAWSARSAQLCKAAGASHFVALRYPFEAVTAQDDALSQRESEGTLLARRPVAGPVYIPIYTPSGPSTIVPETAPSKLGAIRCLTDPKVLKDPTRAVAVGDALTEARGLGVTLAP